MIGKSMSEQSAHPVVRWAVILGGGRSRRMGTHKANLPMGTRTLLEHAEHAFLKIVDHVVVVMARGLPQPTLSERTTLLRDENEDLGPLEGLRVGLQYCQAKADVVYVGTCDAPLVIPEFYEVLFQHLQNGDAAVPRIDSQIYPLSAVYRPSILSTVEARVQQRQLRVKELLTHIDTQWVEHEALRQVDPNLQTIHNVNTPHEYQDLLNSIQN